MSDKAIASSELDSNPDEAARPRRLSPDISEVLKLIGAMERLVDDVEERHKAVGMKPSDRAAARRQGDDQHRRDDLGIGSRMGDLAPGQGPARATGPGR